MNPWRVALGCLGTPLRGWRPLRFRPRAASIAREAPEKDVKTNQRFLACFRGDLVCIARRTFALLERADPDLTQFGLNPFLLLRIGCHLERLLQLRRAGPAVTLSCDDFTFARDRSRIV
jgi:hypothetical protein